MHPNTHDKVAETSVDLVFERSDAVIEVEGRRVVSDAVYTMMRFRQVGATS